LANNSNIISILTLGRADQVGEVGYSRQRLADDELEGDGCQEKNERQLESTLRYRQVDGERGERQTADKQLSTTTTTTTITNVTFGDNCQRMIFLSIYRLIATSHILSTRADSWSFAMTHDPSDPLTHHPRDPRGSSSCMGCSCCITHRLIGRRKQENVFTNVSGCRVNRS